MNFCMWVNWNNPLNYSSSCQNYWNVVLKKTNRSGKICLQITCNPYLYYRRCEEVGRYSHSFTPDFIKKCKIKILGMPNDMFNYILISFMHNEQ